MSHKARKRFGQNFLKDLSVIERLLNALDLAPDDHVLEIGPGLGALTLPMFERLKRLTVAEIDRDLIARLEAMHLPGLQIRAGDVMQLDLAELLCSAATNGKHAPSGSPPQGIRVVGNLPYNIATPLLMRLLEHQHLIRDIHVMLQKEVVDRLHANPGNRAFGRLSVLIQSVFHVNPMFTVPPEAFNPAPKVLSAIVRLTPRADALDAPHLAALQHCTRLAFANKRKTLRNNFKGHLDDDVLLEMRIDPQSRAETLDLPAFHRLASALSS